MGEIKNFIWGGYWFKANPEKVGNEILSIWGKDLDNVPAQELLEYARENPESELHKCFTWDDEEAAEKWRVHEARQICCSLAYREIKRTKNGEEIVSFRLMMKSNPNEGYNPTTFIFKNDKEKKGMTTSEVSKGTGIAENVFSNWKKRRGNLRPANFYKIALFLNVPKEYLMGEKESE